MPRTLKSLLQKADGAALTEVWAGMKAKRPLLYHLTNWISASFQADAVCAAGASPIMSRETEEAAHLAAMADGVLCNVGALERRDLPAVQNALAGARLALLDPVGYGATPYRRRIVDDLLQNPAIRIIKGNRGEISLLAGHEGTLRGVDALSARAVPEAVMSLARRTGALVCATGETDLLSDGSCVAAIRGGSFLLPAISGSGCVLGSLMLAGACGGEHVAGGLAGVVAMKRCAERAERKSSGPGTFRAALLDELFLLQPSDFAEELRRCTLLQEKEA